MAQEQLDIRVTESGAKEVERNVNDIGTTAESTTKKVGALGGALDTLRTLIAAAGIGFGITQLIQYGEAYQKIIGQIRGVVSSNVALIATEKELFAIAQLTRQSFEGTVSLYSNLAKATQGLNIDQKEILKVTTLVNKTLTASGSTADDSAGAIKRLSLALSRGTFDARAVTTIMLQFPALGRAVAQGLGVSIAQLTRMAEEGQITARDFFRGVQQASDKIEARFKAMPVTIAQAFTLLQNEFLRFIGQINQANGITGLLSSGIVFLANNFNTLIKTISVLIATYGAYRAALIVSSIATVALAAANGGLVTSFIAATASLGFFGAALAVVRGLALSLWAVFLANPFVFIITVVTALAAAIYAFGNSVKLTSDGSVTALGALVGVYNLLAAAIGKAITWISTFSTWLASLPGAVQVLYAGLAALGVVLAYVAASQIIAFLSALAGAILAVGTAMITLLLNPLGLAVAAFVAAAVATAYFTGTLDTLFAKVSQFGNLIGAEMKKATAGLNNAGSAGTDAGNKIKAGADLGGSGVEALNKHLKHGAGAAGEASVAFDFYVDTVVDGQGRIKAVLRQVSEGTLDPIKQWEEMRRRQVQASVDLQNAYYESSQKVGDSLELAARRGTQAFYDLQNAGAAAAASTSQSFSSAAASASSAASGGKGGATQNNPQPQQYTTDYSPKWGAPERGQLSDAGGGGLVGLINGWLGKWGGRAVSQGKEFADVREAAGKLDQNIRQRIKDFGFSWIPGLRYGGSMVVPGSGAPDSMLAQLRVTPGERITVQTPEQQRKQRPADAGGGQVIHITMNIATADAESFRRSKEQIQMELLSELGRVAGRL